jgi:hypothetical protein
MTLSTILAALLTLAPGYNNTGAAGEVVAVSAATSDATATVAIKSVDSLTTYTNLTAQVVTFESAWKVVYTNFDGSAAITTNVVGYLDWDAFKATNGVQRIIKDPVRFDLPSPTPSSPAPRSPASTPRPTTSAASPPPATSARRPSPTSSSSAAASSSPARKTATSSRCS